MMSTLIFKGDTGESSGSGAVTPEDMEMIARLMGEKDDDDDGEYKLK